MKGNETHGGNSGLGVVAAAEGVPNVTRRGAQDEGITCVVGRAIGCHCCNGFVCRDWCVISIKLAHRRLLYYRRDVFWVVGKNF